MMAYNLIEQLLKAKSERRCSTFALAKLIGISGRQLYRILDGSTPIPNQETVRKIGAFLNVDSHSFSIEARKGRMLHSKAEVTESDLEAVRSMLGQFGGSLSLKEVIRLLEMRIRVKLSRPADGKAPS